MAPAVLHCTFTSAFVIQPHFVLVNRSSCHSRTYTFNRMFRVLRKRQIYLRTEEANDYLLCEALFYNSCDFELDERRISSTK